MPPAMAERPAPRDGTVPRNALFILFAGLYLLGASGTMRDNHDSLFAFGVALNLSRTGSFAVASDVEALLPPSVGGYAHLRGRDGRLYFPKGMSYSVLLVPLVAVGEWLGRWRGLGPELGPLAMPLLLASMAGPLLTAAQCVVLLETALALGFRRRTALLTVIVTGLGTILWADSKANGLEPLHGLLISLAGYGAVRFTRSGSPSWAALVGAAQAVLLLSQPAMILLVVPAVTAYMVAGAVRREAGDGGWARSAIAYGAPLLLGLVLLTGLNAIRYGRLAATGYEWQPGRFQVPLYVGAYGLFFSAGKSLFLYSPPLVLALAGWRAFRERAGWLGTLPLALLAVFVLVYGQFAYWSGDGAWGPRYLVPLTGPLALMLAGILESADGRGAARSLRAGLLSLTALGVAVQVVGVATSTWLYFKLLIDAGVITGVSGTRGWAPILYEPEFSPVTGRARLLLSRAHQAWAGQSLTWDMPLPSGGVKTMDLFVYDELAVWPVLFKRANGDLPSPVIGGMAVLVVIAALGSYRVARAL